MLISSLGDYRYLKTHPPSQNAKEVQALQAERQAEPVEYFQMEAFSQEGRGEEEGRTKVDLGKATETVGEA